MVSALAGAQPAGVISGTDTDEGNRPLADVTVMLTHPDDCRRRSTVTDAKGRYELAGLAAGTYTVTAEVPGFGAAMKWQRITGGRREVWLVLDRTTELREPESVPRRLAA